ncbi:MAG TPA: LLM class flavin-dependent oxidoreductase [Patescibacteria group bacterium]|nr:LLM class flavin-dependent oxidoreductase [Patescibacteria group bacterium]
MTIPRLGIGFLGFPDLRSLVDAGRAAEAAGFESAWVAETRLTRDAVTGVTALLLATKRMRVGSAAINVFTRGAALVAVTWATLSEAAPGRAVLGLGVGSEGPLARQGYSVDHPVGRLRDFVAALRAAWASSGPVSIRQGHVRFESLQLEVRPAEPPPIYLCVGGPRALTLAGQIGDGVVLDAFLPPSFAANARGLLDAGAADGRFGGEVAGAVVVSISDNREAAAAPLKRLLAGYLVGFPELARISGVDPELVERLRARSAADGIEAAASLVSSELVAAHALCGTAGACRERLGEYRSAGYELPVLFPVPGSLDACIRDLAGA